MKYCFRSAVLFLSLASCTHTVPHKVSVSSGERSGIVEVDGLQQCSDTPCEITIPKRLIYVGTLKTEDGYACRDAVDHVVVVFPKTDDPNLFPQHVYLNSCFASDPINVDLTKERKRSERGDFKRKPLFHKYAAFGGIDSIWNKRNDETQNQRYSSVSLAYGQRVYLGDTVTLFGELHAAKRNPLDTPQYELGVKFYLHNAHATAFYLSGGLNYQYIENSFAQDKVSPYLGAGLLLNWKILKEFGRMISWFYTPNPLNDYQIGSSSYDFYVEYGGNFHGDMTSWDATNLTYGLRWYF